jgi:DNA-binding NarL/FixJ family response regulator
MTLPNMMTTLIQTESPGGDAAANHVVQGQEDSRRAAKGTEALASAKSAVPKIAVVDDDENIHVFVNDLADLGHFKLVGSSYNAAQALDRLPEMRPDAVIMDLRLPDMSGIACATKLKTILPGLPIIILTGYPDGRSFFRSLMEGAKGFLVKPVTAQEFLNAVDEVLKGEFALARQVIPFLIQLVHQVRQVTQESRLTMREEEILACLFQGMQDKEIASALGIGTATVHTHMHRLFEKLGVHSRRDIVAKYLELI